MTADQTPLPFTPAVSPKRWLVTMADGSVKVVEAVAFRVEGGALLMVRPAGLVSAYAPGTWATCEPEVAP